MTQGFHAFPKVDLLSVNLLIENFKQGRDMAFIHKVTVSVHNGQMC